MIKKMLIGIICILMLFGICSALERQITPDGETPMTEMLISETVNGVSETFEQIKAGVSSVFNSIVNKFSSEDESNAEIGEISANDLSDEEKEYYERYEKDNWDTTSDQLEGKTKAGDEYKNKNKALPQIDENGEKIKYREYDTQTTYKGHSRGTNRFVHGSDGTTYYTKDHYKTFRKIIN